MRNPLPDQVPPPRYRVSHDSSSKTASGKLLKVKTKPDPYFKVMVPTTCPGVKDARILNPRNTWSDKAAYDTSVRKLAGMFVKNFAQYADEASEAVLNAAPDPTAAGS